MALLRATIEGNLATTLDALTGIENVYRGRRQLSNPQDFNTAYRNAANTKIHTWLINRAQSSTRTGETHPGQVPMRTEMWINHQWDIEFYYSFIDNTTQSEFDAFLDVVLEGFKNVRTLGGYMVDPPLLLTDTSFDYLGDVLCHKGVFRVGVIERLNGLTPA